MPFLYLNLDNQSADDLRELAQTLQTHKPGFYFLVSNTQGKATFYASLDAQYESTCNLTEFAAWLKTTAGLFGGGKKGTIQGGGPAANAVLEHQMKEYLHS